MCENVHYQVALEFGYPKNLIKYFLAENKFNSAGSFLEYLDTHIDDLEAENEHEENEYEEVNEKDIPIKEVEELSLKEETEILYREAHCLICLKNKRNVVALPCCHFIMCATCESSTRQCPAMYCKAKIESCIHTYEI